MVESAMCGGIVTYNQKVIDLPYKALSNYMQLAQPYITQNGAVSGKPVNAKITKEDKDKYKQMMEQSIKQAKGLLNAHKQHTNKIK